MEQRISFDTVDAKRSRKAYTLECAFEYFIALLVADSFLAKLLTSLGFTDAQTGVIASLTSFAFLFQLLAIPVVQKITNVKKFSAIIHSAAQMLFMSLYLVPFLPIAPELRKIVTVICLLLAYLGNYLVTTVIYRWGNSYVDPSKRALFSANKEMISLMLGVLVSLAFGFLMDRFEALGQLEKGFMVAAGGIFIFSLCDLICLLLIKNEQTTVSKQDTVPVADVLRYLSKNRGFLQMVLLKVLWQSAFYLTAGFLGTFKLHDLLYSIGQIQIMNLLGTLARFALSRPFGRYSDKHSYAVGIEAALIFAIGAFVCNVFTTYETRWLTIGYILLYGVCQAGLYANLSNMTYNYVDQRYFVQATAIKNSIGGICGFVASVVGSKILAAVQANGNTFLGMKLYGQQLLSVLSVLILIGTVLWVHFVFRKQRIMRQ